MADRWLELEPPVLLELEGEGGWREPVVLLELEERRDFLEPDGEGGGRWRGKGEPGHSILSPPGLVRLDWHSFARVCLVTDLLGASDHTQGSAW